MYWSKQTESSTEVAPVPAFKRMVRAGLGLALLAVALGFPVTQASAQAICRPIDGSSGALFGAFSNQIYSIDVRTGKATLVTTSSFVGAADGLNSLASDPANLLVYYASNASVSSNRAVYAYDIATGSHFVVDADLTNNGVTVGPRGLGTGAGGFDGGSLYLGVLCMALVTRRPLPDPCSPGS